jgi:hypothetical protein
LSASSLATTATTTRMASAEREAGCTGWAEVYWRGTPGVVEHQHARDKGMGGGTYTDTVGCSAVEDELVPVPATMSRHSHHMVRVCSAKSSTWTGLAGKRRVPRCREDGSPVPLVEATLPVAPRERTTERCGHVLSTRRDLVDGLGCVRGERDMRWREAGDAYRYVTWHGVGSSKFTSAGRPGW